MTLPEYIQAKATWWDRFCCKTLGHQPYGRKVVPWHPYDIEEDRDYRERLNRFCARCGHTLETGDGRTAP